MGGWKPKTALAERDFTVNYQSRSKALIQAVMVQVVLQVSLPFTFARLPAIGSRTRQDLNRSALESFSRRLLLGRIARIFASILNLSAKLLVRRSTSSVSRRLTAGMRLPRTLQAAALHSGSVKSSTGSLGLLLSRTRTRAACSFCMRPSPSFNPTCFKLDTARSGRIPRSVLHRGTL
jgi:hypothetical protein